MTDSMEQAYKTVLEQALNEGYNQLKKGNSSLDAVEQAIHVMEDSPLFNAGKGAVFTNEGKNELDASIMDGKTLAAGAVAGVTTIRNPISAARAVMEKSEHVMMVGKGAEEFAKEAGLQIVDPSYFWTKMRWDALQKLKKRIVPKHSWIMIRNRVPVWGFLIRILNLGQWVVSHWIIRGI
nr:isoaspartyl peptidase/L-asparaginase [Sphingobacterium sp. E70]